MLSVTSHIMEHSPKVFRNFLKICCPSFHTKCIYLLHKQIINIIIKFKVIQLNINCILYSQ